MTKIKLDNRNARIHSERNKTAIKSSLTELGAGRSIVIDNNNIVIGGNGVFEEANKMGLKVRIIESDGTELVAIKRTDLNTDDEKRKALALADNKTNDLSSFNEQQLDELLNEIENDELKFSTGFNLDELDELGLNVNDLDNIENDENRKTLSEQFLAPPFSVFDVRQGYWQERKKAWLAIGLQSEVGRDNVQASMGSAYIVKKRSEGKKVTEVPSWAVTSIFDPVLCEICYSWLSAENNIILDPFAGGSVRGVIASKLKRNYVGVELRSEQVKANREQAKTLCNSHNPVWHEGDSKNIEKLCSNLQADLIFSCPPYADLEVYSDNPQDLSNMKYSDFVTAYREIIKKSCALLKEDSFACFVVGEVRSKKGEYYNFVGDTIQAFIDAGLSYYNDAVLLTSLGTAPIRAGKAFKSSRKLCKVHQNVLIFVKGDPKKATAKLGNVEIKDFE